MGLWMTWCVWKNYVRRGTRISKNIFVRWGENLGEWFRIVAGVRQGGILSPDFYSLYVDDLVKILTSAGIGCHIRNAFFSILLYADDMCLMAPSLKGLQRLLILTEKYCKDWDIMLNPKKSKNIQFGTGSLARARACHLSN